MSASGPEVRAGTQTLVRGLALLECVADGIHDASGLASALGKPRSTIHRMLSSLVAEGYLHHLPYEGYLIGPKLIRLGMAGLDQRPLVALARPHLERLALSTGDTVHLAEPDGAELIYLQKISGRRGLEMRSRPGRRMPIASTGVGKGLMLALPEAEWRRLYDAALERGAGGERPALASFGAFEAAMRGYRDQGFSFDFEENEIGVRCVGAPVRGPDGKAVAGISVASAVPFMAEERMHALGPEVAATARAISMELGFREET